MASKVIPFPRHLARQPAAAWHKAPGSSWEHFKVAVASFLTDEVGEGAARAIVNRFRDSDLTPEQGLKVLTAFKLELLAREASGTDRLSLRPLANWEDNFDGYVGSIERHIKINDSNKTAAK